MQEREGERYEKGKPVGKAAERLKPICHSEFSEMKK